MNAEIIPFEFEQSASSIRVVEIDGEPWFVAKDVAEVLEYSDSTMSNMGDAIKHVPEEWKGRVSIPTPGGLQDLWCLSEPGIYFFVGRSEKPKALPFQKWVAGEVLPSLRQRGIYFFVGRSEKPKALPFQKWVAGEVLPSLRQRGYYGTLKAGDVLRYHNALSRIVKQLETTKNTLSQRILLQQVQGICSTLRLTMPKVDFTKAATTDLEGNHATAVG